MNCKIYLFLIACLCCHISSAQSFLGAWQGELSIGSTRLPLLFEIRYDGQWSGTMQSPKQNPTRFPFSRIEVQGDSLFLAIRKLGISYAGRLSEERTEIDGTFTQGGVQVALQLARSDSAIRAPRRTQRVLPPYDYDTLDVTFPNTIDGHQLAGTITRPKRAGTFPAVVLVSGSGPHDRNESMMGHEPFKVLADYLTGKDIVVLRYDDRGIGESAGDFAKATTGDFGGDALAALDFLANQPKVDAGRIGVLGHSEGGLIATILAGQQVENLSFIISLAGPTIPMDSLLLLQNEAIMASVGQQMTASDRAMIKRNYQLAASELPAKEAFNKILQNMKDIQGSQDFDGADQIGALVTPWFRHFLRIDPEPFIAQITVPVFAAYGGKDIQVPARPNQEALMRHLRADSRHHIKTYPSLNHLFQHAQTGTVSEYESLEETLSAELMDDLAEWIKFR